MLQPLEGEEPEMEEEEEEANRGMEDEGEETQAKTLSGPIRPTQEMVEQHEVTHIPFRNWCSACVRGRAKSLGHYKSDKEEDQSPTISVDYGFFGREGELPSDVVGGSKAPVLVARDRKSKSVWSHAVPSKGIEHPYPSKALLQDIEATGYKRVIVKSDQEPAIIALVNSVKNAFKGDLLVEHSPKGESQSNGEIEIAVQAVQGIARTLKEAVEQKIGGKIGPREPLLAWLTEYAGVLLTLFHKGAPHDGMTAYQRLKGKPWRIALPPFGERVEFRRRTKNKLDTRWEAGVYLGVKMNTTEKIVGNATGTYVVQSMRRLPEGARYDQEMLKSLRGLPWKPQPGPEDPVNLELPMPIALEPEVEEHENRPTEIAPKRLVLKRIYITKYDIEKYGHTAACPACDSTREGRRQGGLQHTDDCRKQIEECMASDPTRRARVDQTNERHDRQMARAIEEHEALAAAGQPAGSAAPQAMDEEPADMDGDISDEELMTDVAHKKRKNEAFAQEEMTGIPDPESEVSLLVETLHEEYILAVTDSGDSEPTCEIEDDYKDIHEPYSSVFIDDVSGKTLNWNLVLEARNTEVETIDEMGVWKVILRTDEKTIQGKWIDINKGDVKNPKYRSRYVAREIRAVTKSKYFAGMPPLSALRMIIAIAVTLTFPNAIGEMIRQSSQYVIGFTDIKRAHFCAPATRRLLVELPEESGYSKDYVGLLQKSMYGCQDAGQNWELEVARKMTSAGFRQGRSNPCLYWHPDEELRVEVHGDDFTSVGPYDKVLWFQQQLKTWWKTEDRGILGPPGMPGTKQEMTILNRILSWTGQGIEWEADPRHQQLVVAALGVTAKVTTPVVKEKIEERDVESPELSVERASEYRSISMRTAYLAQDRPDLQRTTRELAKGLARPTERHWEMLKRVGRYLLHAPRVIQEFKYQKEFRRAEGWADTDHAGCIRTRKSTSGGAVQLGKITTRTYSKGQAVIALSSGEAEYYGLVSCISNVLGEVAIAKDFGILLKGHVWMDATAGIAIGSRRGLGKVKHIDTVFLWCQEYVVSGRISVGKKHTSEMLADILTKAVTEVLMRRMLEGLGFRIVQGRHRLALAA
jgi:hypothetical protein